MGKLVNAMYDVVLMADSEFEYFMNVFPNICSNYGIKKELIGKVIKFIIKQRNKIKGAK